jgi:putative membrane protein
MASPTNAQTRLSRLLGADGLGRIEQAVRQAESGTAGELAVSVAWSCDAYPEATWRAAALAAAAACLAFFAAAPGLEPRLQLAAVLAAAGLGAVLGRTLSPLRRALAGPDRLEAMVRRRAESVFMRRGIAGTERRSGILLFVSVFERRAVVLADSGFSGRVSQAEWDEAVAKVVERGGADLAGGIAAAVSHCRGLLQRAGPAGRDADELPDRPELDGEAS